MTEDLVNKKEPRIFVRGSFYAQCVPNLWAKCVTLCAQSVAHIRYQVISD